jgi:hypothetical protein
MAGLFTALVMPIYTCLDSFLGDGYKDVLHAIKKRLECLYRFHQTGYVPCDLKWRKSWALSQAKRLSNDNLYGLPVPLLVVRQHSWPPSFSYRLGVGEQQVLLSFVASS